MLGAPQQHVAADRTFHSRLKASGSAQQHQRAAIGRAARNEGGAHERRAEADDGPEMQHGKPGARFAFDLDPDRVVVQVEGSVRVVT